MVTISFQVNSDEASKLFSMLKAYGVNNLTLQNEWTDVSHEELLSIEKGIEQANKGMLKDSADVHAKARELDCFILGK